VIGVLRYAQHPITAKPAKCPSPQQAAACIGHVEGTAINHILTAGLAGVLVGLGLALASVLLLRLLRAGVRSGQLRRLRLTFPRFGGHLTAGVERPRQGGSSAEN
jgi:hypothetical protein